MDLINNTQPTNYSGTEQFDSIEEGDMIEISKTIDGVKTVILEYEPPEGFRADGSISFNVIERAI